MLVLSGLLALQGSAQIASPSARPTEGHGRSASALQGVVQVGPNCEVRLASGDVSFDFLTSSFLDQGRQPHQALNLTFRSLSASRPGDYTGGFQLGQGWTTTVGTRLDFTTPTTACLTRGDGEIVCFDYLSGLWQAETGSQLSLVPNGTGWIVRTWKQTEFHYDALGQLEAIVHPSGSTFSVDFSSGSATRVEEPSGRHATFQYDSSGRLESITDSSGLQWILAYDASGRVNSIVYPDFGTVSLIYDSAGRIQTWTDLEGFTRTVKYWPTGPWQGRALSITDPDGDLMSFDYSLSASGVDTMVEDWGGNEWRLRHDTNPVSALMEFEDPLGNKWIYSHDLLGRMAKVTSPSGASWQFAHDAGFNLTQVTDPLAHSTKITYDSLNNLTSQSTVDGTLDLLYGDAENPTEPTSILGYANSQGVRPKTQFEFYGPSDGQVPGEWSGLIKRMTDALGAEINFEYDGLGLRAAIKEGPNGATGGVEVRYDQAQPSAFVDLGGMTYPADFPTLPPLPAQVQGGLSQVEVPGATMTARGRDATRSWTVNVPIDAGSGFEISNVEREYHYDDRGRLLRVDERTEEPLFGVASPPIQAPMRSYSLSYNDATSPASGSLESPDGDKLTLAYDAAGRLVQTSLNAGEIDQSVAYYADGSVKSITRSNGTTTHLSYEANGLVASVEHRTGSTIDLRIETSYDARDLPVCVTEILPAETVKKTFEYDEGRNLALESTNWSSSGNTVAETFGYDLMGNRTTHTVSINGLLRESAVYHYDYEDPVSFGSHNNRLTSLETFDALGQPVNTTWFFYENPYGNVSHIVRNAAGKADYSATVLIYTEFGLPWLLWDESWTDTGSGPTGVLRSNVIETRQAGAFSYLWRERDAVSFAPLPGAQWSNLLGAWSAAYTVDQTNGDHSRLHFDVPAFGRSVAGGPITFGSDQLGTIRRVTQAGVSSLQDFSAFGSPLNNTVPSTDSGFAGGLGARQAFQGQPFPLPGLVKMGFRWYEPSLGRFLMRDPISLWGGPNLYVFAHNRPTALVDPDGLSAHGSRYPIPAGGIDVIERGDDIPCLSAPPPAPPRPFRGSEVMGPPIPPRLLPPKMDFPPYRTLVDPQPVGPPNPTPRYRFFRDIGSSEGPPVSG